jgi:hypothetical protein
MYRLGSEAMMADLEFDDFEDGYDTPVSSGKAERARRIINISGAVCSVALVLGLTLWGYKLAVRDVSGVPVMRAMVGPMRIAPDDPGGNQASNQGLSVNTIAATGTSAALAEQVILAPRAVELQSDDMAGLAAANTAPAPLALTDVKLTISGTAAPGTAADAPAATSVAPQPIPVTASLGDVELPAPAVGHSIRPHARPAALTVAPQSVQTVSAPGPAVEIDPATLVAGTRLAQLGAFDTPDLAREKFVALQAQFGELMAAKAMVIQGAQSGGRTFYRLRAHGFEGEDDARRFCAALQAEGADCIPVAQR